jgi:hypothetical protein
MVRLSIYTSFVTYHNPHSYRFAYTDYALAHALKSSPVDGIPLYLAYDSACSYAVNIVARFREHLSDFVDAVEKAEFLIDSLHVHNHIEKCMYLYSSSYREGAAHFTANGNEQYFLENNHLGPQTRQANPGHRIDKLTMHHSFWNWIKLTKLGECYI